MCNKIESDISTSSGGDVSSSTGCTYATPLFGVLYPVQMPVTGLSKDKRPESGSKVSYQSTKSGGFCDVIPTKSNQRANGHELAPDTSNGKYNRYALTGWGCKAKLESQI